MEIDVLVIDSRDGKQTVYVSEVITHLDGSGYSGSPTDKERWAEFGNESYQRTLEKLWHKFFSGHNYVTRVFSEADEYVFQLWAPRISKGHLTDGFERLSDDFGAERGKLIEFVINETYTERIDELRIWQPRSRKTTVRQRSGSYRLSSRCVD